MKMRLDLCIQFSDKDDYITMTDVPVIPREGEIFSCEWHHFTDNDELLDEIYEIEKYEIFVVSFFMLDYNKSSVVCTIMLMPESKYKMYNLSKD